MAESGKATESGRPETPSAAGSVDRGTGRAPEVPSGLGGGVLVWLARAGLVPGAPPVLSVEQGDD
jgi:hypothetical protein